MPAPAAYGAPVVMIIDDDELGRAILADSVRPFASRVIELSSPMGATVAAAREAVDLVIIDWQMPNLTGDMLTKLLRKHPRLRNVGVVLVSAEKPEALRAIGESCGADAVVSKQLLASSLPLAMTTAIQISRGRAAREPVPQTPVSGFQRKEAAPQSVVEARGSAREQSNGEARGSAREQSPSDATRIRPKS
jgi:CheY-like chemotaxis protein